MLRDFKAFVLRGNVVDLAIAVVIGAAFGSVVTSLVQDIFTPLLAIPGSADFANLSWTLGGSHILYGKFLNALISFLVISVVVFFFVVKPVNLLLSRRKTEPEVEETTRACDHCLSSIPRSASVCAFCTRDVTPVA